ncbi:hypothetical protein [Rhizobium sp. 2YAF20]|uniref:hypothetical protein n=1 Tax=Rhizobium sp. 2YAF20 TaxID=3233027 RepID=UPI003F9C2925
MWRPHRPFVHHALIHDAAVQIGPDQPDDPGVLDALLKAIDQDVVIDPVKGRPDTLPTTETFLTLL